MLAYIHGSVSQADIRKIEMFRTEFWQVIHAVLNGESVKEAVLQQGTDTIDLV